MAPSTLATKLRNRATGYQAKLSFGPFPVRRALWRIYLRPDAKRPSVNTPADWNQALSNLERYGIAILPRLYTDVAAGLTKYLAKLDSDLAAGIDRTGGAVPGALRYDANDRHGHELTASLSFSDPNVVPVVRDRSLLGVVYNYFRRQPYYRNQPVLVRDRFRQDSELYSSGNFHIDGFRQVSLMLLTSDLADSDTHMQYALESHYGRQKKIVASEPQPERTVTDRYELFDCVGPAGTAFLFDAGAGFHRGLYRVDTVRAFLHLNWTTGWMGYVGPRLDESWDGLDDVEPFVARSFRDARRP